MTSRWPYPYVTLIIAYLTPLTFLLLVDNVSSIVSNNLLINVFFIYNDMGQFPRKCPMFYNIITIKMLCA